MCSKEAKPSPQFTLPPPPMMVGSKPTASTTRFPRRPRNHLHNLQTTQLLTDTLRSMEPVSVEDGANVGDDESGCQFRLVRFRVYPELSVSLRYRVVMVTGSYQIQRVIGLSG